MALAIFKTPEAAQQTADQLAGRYDVEGQARKHEELRRIIASYELRYGVSSENLHDAIEAGLLDENQEVGDWIFQYSLLCRVEAC
jgi:hypothetical protein